MTAPKQGEKRISFRIQLPSIGFSQFLRQVVLEEETFRLFLENTEKVLQSHGVELDPSVSKDVLMRLRFTIVRARHFVVKENVDRERFEKIFGIFGPIFKLQDTSYTIAVEVGGIVVEESEQKSETEVGSKTEWEHYESSKETRSDHFYTKSFAQIFEPLGQDRFLRTPLLDAATLGRLMTQLDIRLKEFGKY